MKYKITKHDLEAVERLKKDAIIYGSMLLFMVLGLTLLVLTSVFLVIETKATIICLICLTSLGFLFVIFLLPLLFKAIKIRQDQEREENEHEM